MSNYTIFLTQHAGRDLKSFPIGIRKRILTKLQWFADQADPIEFAKPLRNVPPSKFRFRIGKIRVFFFVRNNSLIITGIEDRSRAYR